MVGTAGIGVGAVQGQRRAAILGQAAGPGKDAVECECLGPEHGQPGIERNVVGQRCQAGGIQRGSTTDGQCARAQRCVIAEHQSACIERHATTEGIGAGEGLYARAHLDQATTAADHAIERGVAGRTEGERIAAQRQRASSRSVECTDGLVAAGAGDIEASAGAQRDIARCSKAASGSQCQRASIDGGAAGVGVGTGQGQRGGAILDQAAVAADHARERQRVAARYGQRDTRAQRDRIAEGDCSACIQRGAGSHRQRAGTQRTIRTDDQATTVQGQAATEGVGVVEGQQARTVLDQAAIAGHHATERDIVAAAQRQLRARTEVHCIGQVQRHRAVQRGGATDAQRTGAERAGIAEDQATGVERNSATEGVGTGQRLHAGTRLDQAASATDHTGKAAVAGAAKGQRLRAQRQLAAGDAVECADGLRGTGCRDVQRRTGAGKIHRTRRGKAATGPQRQRAGVDGGATPERVGARQREARRAILDQPAGAEHRTGQRQVIAAQHGEVGARSEAEGVAHRKRRSGIQRSVAAHVQLAGTQRLCVAKLQYARVEPDAPAERIGAVQCQCRRTVLDQPAGAADDALQRHVLAAQQIQHRTGAEVDVVGQVQRHRTVQRGIGPHRQCTGTQRAGIAQQQAAAVDGQPATEAVGAIEGQGGGTVLHQPARTGDHPAQRDCLRTRQRQRGACTQCHVVAQVQRRTAVERDVATDAQRPGAECAAVAQQQGASVRAQSTTEGVGTVQGQCRRAVLDQAAGARDVAGQGQVLAARQGQGRAEVDRIAQVQRCRGIQRAVATDRQRAASQRTGIAQHQATGRKVQATTEGIGAGQRLHAGALLDQATGAADHARERLVGGITEGERAAAQRHRAAGNTGQRADGLVAAERDVQVRANAGQADRTAGGQASAAAHRNLAGIDRQAAGEGIRATQRKRGGTVLDQAAAAANDTAQRQCVRAQHIERATRAQRDAIADRKRRAGVKRHHATNIQRTGSQCSTVAQHQAAGIERHAAAEGIGAIERQRRRTALDQATGATDHAVERQRLVAKQIEAGARTEVDRVGQCKRSRGSIERHVATDTERTAAQRSSIAQQQATGVECHAATEVVHARQGLHAGAQLDQASRACGERAAVAGIAQPREGERAAAQVDRTAEARQRTDGLVGGRRQVQGGTDADRDRTGGRQAAARAQRQRASGQVETAGQRIGAVQGERAGAVLGQVAGTGDRTIQ